MNYDQFLELIRSRTSCRNFTDQKVSNEDMSKIMEAGLWSASAHRTQNVKIIRIKDQKIKNVIKMKTELIMLRSIQNFDPFYNAPEILLVCAPRTGFESVDGALVLGHMMDAAQSIGLGSCWINTAQVEQKFSGKSSILDFIFDYLGLKNHVGIGYLAIGHKNQKIMSKPMFRMKNRIFEV